MTAHATHHFRAEDFNVDPDTGEIVDTLTADEYDDYCFMADVRKAEEEASIRWAFPASFDPGAYDESDSLERMLEFEADARAQGCR